AWRSTAARLNPRCGGSRLRVGGPDANGSELARHVTVTIPSEPPSGGSVVWALSGKGEAGSREARRHRHACQGALPTQLTVQVSVTGAMHVIVSNFTGRLSGTTKSLLPLFPGPTNQAKPR